MVNLPTHFQRMVRGKVELPLLNDWLRRAPELVLMSPVVRLVFPTLHHGSNTNAAVEIGMRKLKGAQTSKRYMSSPEWAETVAKQQEGEFTEKIQSWQIGTSKPVNAKVISAIKTGLRREATKSQDAVQKLEIQLEKAKAKQLKSTLLAEALPATAEDRLQGEALLADAVV